MSNTKKPPEKKSLTRFNVIYEDPYKIFLKYLKGELSLHEIGQKCKNCQIYPEFRSILYRIFLGILPYNNPGCWKEKMEIKRKEYDEKLNKLLSKSDIVIPFINCHALKGTNDYETLFVSLPEEDRELLSLIKLDVDRTFQDLDLFHDNKVKEILCKILYVFSKDNPAPSYCQGMNEILGTLFYCFLSSFRFNKFTKEEQNANNNGKVTNEEMLYSYLVDNNYIENDLFIIYSELMSRDMTLLYTYNEDKFKTKVDIKYDLKNLKEEDLEQSNESDLIKRIKKIFYINLPKLDKKYFDFLFGIIEPNVFLLRWILCILDREISLKHVLWVWDLVFYYEFIEYTFIKKDLEKESGKHCNRLNFLDIVCISMIMDLKPLVQSDDQSIILCRFMKFPDEKNIRQIIKFAVELAPQFNGNIKIWNIEEAKKSVNYLEK